MPNQMPNQQLLFIDEHSPDEKEFMARANFVIERLLAIPGATQAQRTKEAKQGLFRLLRQLCRGADIGGEHWSRIRQLDWLGDQARYIERYGGEKMINDLLVPKFWPSAVVPGNGTRDACAVCGGSGHEPVELSNGYSCVRPCSACHGEGKTAEKPPSKPSICRRCEVLAGIHYDGARHVYCDCVLGRQREEQEGEEAAKLLKFYDLMMERNRAAAARPLPGLKPGVPEWMSRDPIFRGQPTGGGRLKRLGSSARKPR